MPPKTTKHYIARIEEVRRPEVTLKYLRHRRENTFVYPQEDISRQTEDDIVCILKEPTEMRGIFTFEVNIKNYNF